MSEELMRVQCVPMATFDPATLTGTYQALNGTGFSDDVKILQIFNGSTTVGVIVSLDGVTDHLYWPPQGTLIIDLQSNHSNRGTYSTGTLNVARSQILWGKTAASQTDLFISGYR